MHFMKGDSVHYRKSNFSRKASQKSPTFSTFFCCLVHLFAHPSVDEAEVEDFSNAPSEVTSKGSKAVIDYLLQYQPNLPPEELSLAKESSAERQKETKGSTPAQPAFNLLLFASEQARADIRIPAHMIFDQPGMTDSSGSLPAQAPLVSSASIIKKAQKKSPKTSPTDTKDLPSEQTDAPSSSSTILTAVPESGSNYNTQVQIIFCFSHNFYYY